LIFSANNFRFFSSENVLNLTTIGTSNLQKNSGRDLSLFLLYHLFLYVSLCLGFCLGFLSLFVFHSFSLFFTLFLCFSPSIYVFYSICFLFSGFLILWVSHSLGFLLSTFLSVYVSYSLRFLLSTFLTLYFPCFLSLTPVCLFLSVSFFYFL
jgi:hypothetical protein